MPYFKAKMHQIYCAPTRASSWIQEVLLLRKKGEGKQKEEKGKGRG